MSDLRDLYQEVILDHNRHPRNRGTLEGANREAVGYNPLCGDRLVVRLRVEDGRIADARFEGSGCAISTASASVMTETLKGRTVDEALVIFERFHEVVTGRVGPEALTRETSGVEGLDKLAVFAGVSEFPVRVKCATLSWHTTKAALDQVERPVSTE